MPTASRPSGRHKRGLRATPAVPPLRHGRVRGLPENTALTATAFNALAAARDLKAAGIEAEHAEAIAEGMRQAAGADRADLATKADLDALRGDLDALRKETKADLHREIGALRSELRWMLGFLAALILAMAAKLFGIV